MSQLPGKYGRRIEKFATIARPPDEIYAAWSDLQSLPLVMPNVKRMESRAGAPSRWSVAQSTDAPDTWETEILVDQPGERISWRADDAPVKHAGTVRFEPAPGGLGTEVTVEIEYVPQSPDRALIEVDLRRFKSVLEADAIAASDPNAPSIV
jgi:uncharacterized membrane protein